MGAEFHKYLINWREGPVHRVHVADSRYCESKYIADLPFYIHTAKGIKKVILRDVIYMENFPRGLVSVSKLAERGIETLFQGPECSITSKTLQVKVQKNPSNGLYLLHTSLPRDEKRSIEANLDEIIIEEHEEIDGEEMSRNQRKLFDLHSSLGHCSLKMLRAAVANGHITGITLSDLAKTLENCEICKTAKLRAHTTKDSYTDFPATQPFERVHGDYGGKYKETRDGKCGFSMYVDELTYWISGKLLERKNEVCDHFQNFYEEVRTIGYTIQGIHTDSAKEYIEKATFVEWLRQRNIRATASSPHAQYQNGFAEVTMQQIQNHIRCALYQSGLPHSYWGDAFQYIIFTWNRTPKALSGGVTPYEMVMGKIPDVKFMHPFGCQASAIHHQDDLPKFSPKGRPCIFIGYDTIRKGYRLLLLENMSILIRAPRDVTFEDSKFPIRENKMSANMKELFSDIGKDITSKAQTDFVDFFIPNPPLRNRGGVYVPPHQLIPSHTPPLLVSEAPNIITPPLFLHEEEDPPLDEFHTPSNGTMSTPLSSPNIGVF